MSDSGPHILDESLPVIDAKAITVIQGIGLEADKTLFGELVQMFHEDSPPRIADIEASLKAQDSARLAQVAHSLKGSAAAMGAVRLRVIAERIEHQAKRGDLADTHKLVALIADEFARACTELRAMLPPA